MVSGQGEPQDRRRRLGKASGDFEVAEQSMDTLIASFVE